VITGAQIREARRLLRWRAWKLGRRASLPNSTIHRAECTDGVPPITSLQQHAIRVALESAGVEFTNGDKPGVKLRTGSA
jgi:hypothetical protein